MKYWHPGTCPSKKPIGYVFQFVAAGPEQLFGPEFQTEGSARTTAESPTTIEVRSEDWCMLAVNGCELRKAGWGQMDLGTKEGTCNEPSGQRLAQAAVL